MSNSIAPASTARAMRGFSMVELMFACFVLASAILGSVGMIIMGMSRNAGVRMDTTATNVAQTVLEQIASTQPNSDPTLTITDCKGNAWTITTKQGGPAPDANGNIDFSQAIVNGYQASYVVCSSSGGGFQATYDVRWSVQNIQVGGGTWAKLIIVAAQQPLNVQNGRFFYTPPVTLRTVVGMDPTP